MTHIRSNSLHSLIDKNFFNLREKVLNNYKLENRIYEINNRNNQHLWEERFHKGHNENLNKISRAFRVKHQETNYKNEEQNMNLLNKLRNISKRHITPPKNTYNTKSLILNTCTLEKKQIELDNKRFLKKLVRVISPLDHEKMDIAYMKNRELGKIKINYFQ